MLDVNVLRWGTEWRDGLHSWGREGVSWARERYKSDEVILMRREFESQDVHELNAGQMTTMDARFVKAETES